MVERNEGNAVINGVDTEGLKKTVQEIKSDKNLGRCKFRISNKWIDGDENRSQTQNFYAAGSEQKHTKTFHFQAGEPLLLMGKDEGANPVEYLLSALAGCMTTTIAYYSALNGQKIEEISSTFEGDLDLQGLFGLDATVRPGYQEIRVNFRIKTLAPAEDIKKYYPFSPVYDVVSKSVPVTVTVETYS